MCVCVGGGGGDSSSEERDATTLPIANERAWPSCGRWSSGTGVGQRHARVSLRLTWNACDRPRDIIRSGASSCVTCPGYRGDGQLMESTDRHVGLPLHTSRLVRYLSVYRSVQVGWSGTCRSPARYRPVGLVPVVLPLGTGLLVWYLSFSRSVQACWSEQSIRST